MTAAVATTHLSDQERRALTALKEVMVRLLDEDLDRLVLFGSKARGDAEPGSDVDVAIVVRNLTAESRDRILERVADVELEHLGPLSTLVLSVEQLERLRGRERRLALDLDREGVRL